MAPAKNIQPASIRGYLITGLLIWVPLVITLWVLSVIVGTMDQSLALLPERWHPRALFGRDIPGLGVLLTLVVILVTGLLTRNFLGQRIVVIWEAAVGRIPIVRSIYSSVKQVSDTVLSPTGQAFRKALLVQYPRPGAWTIAFQTGTPAEEIRRLVGEEMVSVYVPTTPNPTSGFFLMLPSADVIELGMSVDAALKYVVSMGVASPIDAATDKRGTRIAAPSGAPQRR
ncbi:MAG: DUF502 domain-containing protein [Burkholderiaceae bacterium]|nr:DUF502 domain-containing protein [Burkholderiaceae bacterium]